jgi:cytochrome c553
MIISDERYAAALIADESGSGRHVYMYDDIGCLLDHERQLAGRTIRARYVHDVTSKQWVESEQAYFARSPKVQTPMASGIIAASFKADVEQQAGAPAVRFADLGGAEAAAAASAPAGDSAKGKAMFAMTCIACHGPEGQGVPNVGLPLHTSEFVASKTDQQLVDFQDDDPHAPQGRQPHADRRTTARHRRLPPPASTAADYCRQRRRHTRRHCRIQPCRDAIIRLTQPLTLLTLRHKLHRHGHSVLIPSHSGDCDDDLSSRSASDSHFWMRGSMRGASGGVCRRQGEQRRGMLPVGKRGL